MYFVYHKDRNYDTRKIAIIILKFEQCGFFIELLSTVNFLNFGTPKTFVVITLKFELCGSTIE